MKVYVHIRNVIIRLVTRRKKFIELYCNFFFIIIMEENMLLSITRFYISNSNNVFELSLRI